MKIVFLDTDTVGEVDNMMLLKELGDLEMYNYTPSGKTVERLQNADIVITNKVLIDKNVLDACPSLKLICIAATGTNNVDLEYAREKGVEVRNTKDYSTQSVTQATFAMLFYLLHQLTYYDEYVKSGEYAQSPIFTNHFRQYWELNGKNFGIIGLGDIGKSVAGVARTFGSNVNYYSTSGKNNNTDFQQVDLQELLVSSDVISIHCPLNDRTLNLIGENELQMMKSTAYLLNLGRGGIVNEKALAKAIDEQIIAGAALDVLENEPINADNPLLQIQNKENLLITPHIAWASREARELLLKKIYNNIKAFMANGA
ncbi:MAG: D-2-hydroxyacid dehydrogenase [Bacteroidetes bacterium]|jgi:glycerate dehydrogenase|nr:D-2-hydroxyacid dehydrogenase [Bacteroidota bacterium]